MPVSPDPKPKSHTSQSATSLIEKLEEVKQDEDLDGIDAFFDWLNERDIEPYAAQEEAIFELFDDNNVILSTPTGSGKSLVATAAHFAALLAEKRSFYTAPIKALVSEKFFSLVAQFGSDNVGMITGDGSVNASAPIICCTAEILANMVLRNGSHTDVDLVIMDEFHYYSDKDRGWAWQIPLLELSNAQFLLMSATLGDTTRFIEGLHQLTQRETVEVSSTKRPVPLNFEYRETTLLESVTELVETGRAPVYIVYFTQREATESAQSLTSLNVLTKEERQQIKEEIGHFRFDSPIGKDLRRALGAGIGIHHAGLLPKYRLLVERLAQKGLLKLICGTDTLGVGVNVPIRTVLLSQLCKFDGHKVGILKVRDFHQIAGRAGRKGFDDEGHVWAQAPAHVVENRKLEAKAQGDAKKLRKINRKKPPERGYVHFSEQTFEKLINSAPEALSSRFDVTHQFVLNVLDRPGDGCAALRHILVSNHETRSKQRRHIKKAISIYRSLIDAEIIEGLDTPDELDRLVRINIDLQDDFALNHPLSLFGLQAIEALEADSDTYALDVLSVIEAITETPRVITRAQLDYRRTELLTELKTQAVEYDVRMDRLQELDIERPLKEFIYPAFGVFHKHHPWVGYTQPEPKSITRDLWERVMTFSDYVNFYGLKRSEGVLLRYLGDTYKGLVQNVPEQAKTDSVYELTEWLGELIRAVDSSLITEWENLAKGEISEAALSAEQRHSEALKQRDVTQNEAAFKVMVRNVAFSWVQALARDDYEKLATHSELEAETLKEGFSSYFLDHDQVLCGPAERSPEHFEFNKTTGVITQQICDPQGWGEWFISGHVDFEASKKQMTAICVIESISRNA